jgi:hypothetical protein
VFGVSRVSNPNPENVLSLFYMHVYMYTFVYMYICT